MNSDAPSIPWYRIHLVAHVVLMLLGAAFLLIQNVEGFMAAPHGYFFNVVYYGWPLRYDEPLIHSLLGDIPWTSVVFNSVVALILLTGTGFLIELLIRRVTSRLQFSLTAALVVLVAAAIMLGERYASWNMYALADRMELRASVLLGYPWYSWAPIYFAIFCTLCSFTWLAMHAISRVFRRFDR